jgi:hypothetical protein
MGMLKGWWPKRLLGSLSERQYFMTARLGLVGRLEVQKDVMFCQTNCEVGTESHGSQASLRQPGCLFDAHQRVISLSYLISVLIFYF